MKDLVVHINVGGMNSRQPPTVCQFTQILVQFQRAALSEVILFP